MSDFCDFVPDDPSCQTSGGGDTDPNNGGPDPTGLPDGGENGGPPVGGEGKGEWDDMDKMEKMGRMDGKMSWEEVEEWLDLWLQPASGFRTAIMTTVSIAAGAYLQLFRYQSRTPDYFTYSKQVAGSGTDYYKLANMWYTYGYAIMFTGLSTLHILAWLGILVNTDYLLTMFAAFFAFPFAHLVGGVLTMLAYDNAYTVSQDTTSSYQATALALMYQIQNEGTALMALEVGRYLEDWVNQSNWTYAHYLNLDDDTRDWWRQNAMFQRWLIGMGLPVWHLMDEYEGKERSDKLEKWQDRVDDTVQQLLGF